MHLSCTYCREDAEMDEKRLQSIMDHAVETEELAGCSLLLIKDRTPVCYLESGLADRENNIPVRRDTIFRLYSQSKPITSAAVMYLIEQGKLDLMDEVRTFLPGFASQSVAEQDGLKPVMRPVRISDLLSMTSGLVYPEADASGRAMGELFEENRQRMDRDQGMDTLEFANRMGNCPLAFQPGQMFRYGVSADVLGAVVEVVSGKRFGDFLREVFFEPLGMKDTAFYVPEEKMHRLCRCYQRTPDGLKEYHVDHLCVRDTVKNPPFESGGAGLFSTLDDYAAFAGMLLGGGTYEGKRILSPGTVDFMTRPQVDETGWDNLTGFGYGKLMRICTDPGKAVSISREGEYGWDGWLGTYFANFPKENMTLLVYQNTKDTGTGPMVRKLRNCLLSGL